jgi:hypothetical protein
MATWNTRNNIWGPGGTTRFVCAACKGKVLLASSIQCAPCGSTGYADQPAVDQEYERERTRHSRRMARWKRRKRRLEAILETVQRDDLALLARLLGASQGRTTNHDCYGRLV